MNSLGTHDELESLVTALEAVLLHLKKSRGLRRSMAPLTRHDIMLAAPTLRETEIDLVYFLSKYNGDIAPDEEVCKALGIGLGSLKVYVCRSRSALDRLGITPSITRRRNAGYRISRHAISDLLKQSKADGA